MAENKREKLRKPKNIEDKNKQENTNQEKSSVAKKVLLAPLNFVYKGYLVKYTSADREYRPGRSSQYIAEGMRARKQAINKCKKEIQEHSRKVPSTLRGCRRKYLQQRENTESDRKFRHIQGKTIQLGILFMYVALLFWYYNNVAGTHNHIDQEVIATFMIHSLFYPAFALYMYGGYLSFSARNRMYVGFKYVGEALSRPFTEILPFAVYEDVKYGDVIEKRSSK